MTGSASQDGQRRPTVYRVQAADGRGPWRPGMSHLWHDEAKTYLPDSIVDAFGLDWRNEIPHGWACGCACRSLDGLLKWFTPLERNRLDRMGYTPVRLRADKIIRENADQVIFARREPLTVGAAVMPWCDHDWNNEGINPTHCLKCGKSFMAYAFMECP